MSDLTEQRPSRELILSATAAGTIVAAAGLFGQPAILVMAGGLILVALYKAPVALAASLWFVIALVPEWASDIAFSPLISTLMYRSIVGPLSGADILLLVALATSITSAPEYLREFWENYRSLVHSYFAFLIVVLASAVVNGQLGHPVLTKPLFYLGFAVLWGYACSRSFPINTWLPYIVAVSAVLVTIQGLVNALTGAGRAFAGLHIAFYDRASVFLLVVVVAFAMQGWLARSPSFRGIRGLGWAVAVSIFAFAIALSLRRTMWLTLVVAALATMALHWHRGSRRMLIGGGLAMAAVGGMVLILWMSGYLGTLATHATSLVSTLSGQGEEASITTRFSETADVLRAIRTRPLLGHGPAGAYTPSSDYALALDHTYVHDNYLWVMLHYGVIGLLSFLTFGWRWIAALTRSRRVDPNDMYGLMRLALASALIGLAPALFGDSFVTAHNRWPILLGFLTGAALGLQRLSSPLFTAATVRSAVQDLPGQALPRGDR